MKKFSQINENNNIRDLSYTSFFGKKINHLDSLKERVIDSIIEIIREERGVSEKSFKEYDDIINLVKNRFDNDMLERSSVLYKKGKRISYISEILYDESFNNWFYFIIP